eukprot:6457134-Amphidinium_carterae.1
MYLVRASFQLLPGTGSFFPIQWTRRRASGTWNHETHPAVPRHRKWASTPTLLSMPSHKTNSY